MKLNHEKKVIVKHWKRKECNMCKKQFNKDATLIKHIENIHKKLTRLDSQTSNENENKNEFK